MRGNNIDIELSAKQTNLLIKMAKSGLTNTVIAAELGVPYRIIQDIRTGMKLPSAVHCVRSFDVPAPPKIESEDVNAAFLSLLHEHHPNQFEAWIERLSNERESWR